MVRGKDRDSKKREDMLRQLRLKSEDTESLSLLEFIRRKCAPNMDSIPCCHTHTAQLGLPGNRAVPPWAQPSPWISP